VLRYLLCIAGNVSVLPQPVTWRFGLRIGALTANILPNEKRTRQEQGAIQREKETSEKLGLKTSQLNSKQNHACSAEYSK